MAPRLCCIVAMLLLAACDTQTAPPASVAPLTGRIAYTVYEGTRPVLYTQALDGTDRQRLSLDGVQAGYPREQVFDHQQGCYVDAVPVPRDERVLALNAPVQWSADGQRLTLAVASAYDQSEAVVLGLDGHGAGASPTVANVVAPTFSPDGTHIAYVLWTNQDGVFRLMTTDLATYTTTEHALTREVTNASAIWWAPDGQSLLFSRPGFADGNVTADLRRFDRATGAVTTVLSPFPGHVLDYDPVSGLAVALRVRSGGEGGYVYDSLLLLADGTEVPASSGTRWVGVASGRSGFAIRAPYGDGASGDVEIVSFDGRSITRLPNVPADAVVSVSLDAVP